MVHYTVLIPQKNAGDEIAGLVRELSKVLDSLVRPYEIICIDDHSDAEEIGLLKASLSREPCVRLLRLDRTCGVSAALGAGIAAARGEVIVAMGSNQGFRPEQIPRFLAQLARGDLVFGRRRCTPAQKLWQRVIRIPRWLLLGLEVRDPECLFWAARREAIDGLDLGRGMFRYLPSLVARRGYRVSEIFVEGSRRRQRWIDAWPNPGDLLATWWISRRARWYRVCEITLTECPEIRLSLATLDDSAHDTRRDHSNSGDISQRRDSA